MASVDGARWNMTSDEYFDLECDRCNNHNSPVKEAKAFCSVCSEYLCLSCEKVHRTTKVSRDHEIITGSNIQSIAKSEIKLPIAFCEKHPSMKIKNYCDTHDDFICESCKSSHKKCNIMDISKKVGPMNLATFYNTMLSKINGIKEACETVKVNRKSELSKVNYEGKKCLEDMNNLKRGVMALFEELEKSMSKEIDDVQKKLSTAVKVHVAKCDSIIHEANGHIKTLQDCKKTRDEDVIVVGVMKSAKKIKECEIDLTDIKKKESSVSMSFQPNKALTDQVVQHKSVGMLSIASSENQDQQKQIVGKSLMGVNVASVTDIDVNTSFTSGSMFMPNGDLVVCDRRYNKLKVLDRQMKLKSELMLSSPPWDVAVLDNSNVVVTFPSEKKLRNVSVSQELALGKGKSMKTKKKCWGVAVYQSDIYVTCHDDPGNGEICVLNKKGNLQRKISRIERGTSKFTSPNYIEVSSKGDRIYVSDKAGHILVCLSQQGETIFVYSAEDLRHPVGLYVDSFDNVVICGGESQNIHLVGKDGTKKKTIMAESDGILWPQCVTYRSSDGVLVVGLNHSLTTYIKVFTMK